MSDFFPDDFTETSLPEVSVDFSPQQLVAVFEKVNGDVLICIHDRPPIGFAVNRHAVK